MQKRELSTQAATSLGAFGGSWQPATAQDISSATQVHFALDLDTTRVIIQPESNVYVLINSNPTEANDTTNDLRIAGNGISFTELPFPKGAQYEDLDAGLPAVNHPPDRVLYLHILQITSVASKSCRIIEL